MKPLARIVSSTLVLAALLALGFAAWWLLGALGAQFAALEPQVARVTAIASVVALAAAWLVAQGLAGAARRARAHEVREERLAAYQIFLDTWAQLLRAPQAADAAAAEATLRLLDRLLAMHGAAALLQAHAAMRTLARERSLSEPALRAHFGDALRAIRRDLGADVPARFTSQAVALLLAPQA